MSGNAGKVGWSRELWVGIIMGSVLFGEDRPSWNKKKARDALVKWQNRLIRFG